MNNEKLEMNNEKEEKSSLGLEGKVVSLETKGTPSPNRKARRDAKKYKEDNHVQEIISSEERAFRNRKKKLAKQSRKRNR